MTNILVTGSEGYIGSVLTPKLIKRGYVVKGLDICYFQNPKKLKRNYSLIKKDIRQIENVDLSFFDAIIHLAALSNDPMGELNPKLTEKINYKSTIELARQAKKQGVKRFLFASSCSIYGIASKEVDENSPVNPITAYAKSKILSEKALLKMADKKFTVGILRNSTVYGYSPQLRNDLVVNNFVTCALATNKIEIKSDGSPWRPLIDVRDLSDIFIEFLDAESDKINKKVFNIGFQENNVQIKEVLEATRRAIPACEIVFSNKHGSDTRSYQVNFERFKKIFPKIKQKWTIEKSIFDLIKNIKKQNKEKDFYSDKFSRMATIKKLTTTGKLDKNLYWR